MVVALVALVWGGGEREVMLLLLFFVFRFVMCVYIQEVKHWDRVFR